MARCEQVWATSTWGRVVLGHSLDEHDDYHLDVIAGVVHCLGEGGEEVRGEGEGGGEAVGEEEACTPHLGVGGAILERRACVGGSWYGREYQELEEVGIAGSIRTPGRAVTHPGTGQGHSVGRHQRQDQLVYSGEEGDRAAGGTSGRHAKRACREGKYECNDKDRPNHHEDNPRAQRRSTKAMLT